MSLFVMLPVVLAASGILMLALQLAFASRSTDAIKVGGPRTTKLDKKAVLPRVIANGTFSAAVVLGATYVLYDRMFYGAAPSAPRALVEIVGTLMLYDFLYYLLHRYPFHAWKWFQRVHTVHHKVRYPTAYESLYLHPVENFLGVALLLVCTLIVGPVSAYSFVAIFGVYSWLNILVHCGLGFRSFVLRPLGYMAGKHDLHHKTMKAGNYASITPLPDMLFGTRE